MVAGNGGEGRRCHGNGGRRGAEKTRVQTLPRNAVVLVVIWFGSFDWWWRRPARRRGPSPGFREGGRERVARAAAAAGPERGR